MSEYKGKMINKGIALGEAFVLQKSENCVSNIPVEDEKTEFAKFEKARAEAVMQIETICNNLKDDTESEEHAIFASYKMLLEDEEYVAGVRNRIMTQNSSAARAVTETGEYFAQMFVGMDDTYMQARAEDVRDVSDRMLKILVGEERRNVPSDRDVVVIADEISPSDLISVHHHNILAIVVKNGSEYSHATILMRAMKIPVLIGVGFDQREVQTGMHVLVDGYAGKMITGSAEELHHQWEKMLRQEREYEGMLRDLKDTRVYTKDGKQIMFYANIGSEKEAEDALLCGADGIGLFRSEFLYMGRNTLPGEDEQYAVYKQVLEKMDGRKVVIRTIDIGADKRVLCIPERQEKNPALGMRGIRLCLQQPELLKTQMRALLRAGMHGDLAVMYPMITSVWEVTQLKELMAEVKQELDAQSVPYKEPEQGIMIETPAAVMISDELADMADFFSIGTNDLTQYTLAVDREDGELHSFYDPHHEAVFRMIRMVAEHAHQKGIRVSVCGELSGDVDAVRKLIDVGVDELSVSPSKLPEVKQTVLQYLL